MAKVDIQALRRVAKPKGLQNLAYGAALSKINKIRNETLKDFNDHAVTQELEGEENAEGTQLPDGNLYSFIGFTKGEKPIEPLREELKKISVTNSATVSNNGDLYTFSFKASIPDIKDIEAVTPMPKRWASGSWALRIERGISGLQHYIFGVFSRSFSGTGLQVKGKIRDGTYKPRKYISEILRNLRAKL